jgi:predicted DsbA family dithiol-disulfide isomerase
MNDILQQMRIDIVSDVYCPWCIIGFKALAQTLRQINLQSENA